MDRAAQLMALQKAHSCEHWPQLELVDNYSRDRESTFAQYVTNYSLIRLQPFVASLHGQTAVTICDGKGLEALYLQEQGLQCTATDLVADHLLALKDKGILRHVAEQDAERLSYEDDAFDWGLVKAGLHHLQRPVIGLYELLRVSRKGVIMIEAHDSCLLNASKRVLGKVLDYEEAGNYVYRFHRREIEKLCLSLGLPCFALHTSLLPWRPQYSAIAHRGWSYRAHILWFKLLNILLSSQGNVFCTVIFREEPKERQCDILRQCGLRLIRLPRNPYL